MKRPAAQERASTGPSVTTSTANDEASRIVGLYVGEEKTLHETAAIVGRSHTHVQRTLEKLGVPRRQVPPPGRTRPTDRVARVVRRRAAGASTDTIAAEEGVSRATVLGDLHAAGVEIAKPYGNSRRQHPKPHERVCARASCPVRFTPTASQVAKGEGRYCCPSCAQSDRFDLQRRNPENNLKGRFHTCARPGCDRTRWVWDYDFKKMKHGLVFCSRTCWSVERWRRPELVPDTPLRARWNGKARQRWGGIWNSRKPPGVGARPRGRPTTELTPEQLADFDRLRRSGWGRVAIAKRIGLSERRVRALSEERG